MSAQKRNSLGRGLTALLGEEAPDYAERDKARNARNAPVASLHPGKYQPRYVMDSAAIDELAASIASKGVLQPLLVRPHPDHTGGTGHTDQYEIIAGERRWRAAQKAGLHEVPVVIRDLSDIEALEAGLVENLQRRDLSATEEALGYERLMAEFKHTQEKLAEAVGKSRSHVANTLRLLKLPGAVREMVDTGTLSAGHARALIPCAGSQALTLARKVIKGGLNVRQTEQLVKKSITTDKTTDRTRGEATGEASGETSGAKDTNTAALEQDLSNQLGMRVQISSHSNNKGGTLSVRYKDLDQLEHILHRLGRPVTPELTKPAPKSNQRRKQG